MKIIIYYYFLAALLLSYRVECSGINVVLSPSEYYRLTGKWKLDGVALMNNGITTSELILVPECVHTITMKWYSSHDHLQYTVAALHSNEAEVLPVVVTNVPRWGLVPLSSESMSLEFRCNGSGDARVDVTIAVSNRSHHATVATHHTFSLTKRCGVCHDNSGKSGGSQCDDRLQCINGGHCISYDRSDVCVCPKGYHGKHCEFAWCHPNCENGGYCVKPDKCRCRKGFTGNRCHKATCHPECKNGGRCVKVGVCQCNPPYHGARCEQRGHIMFTHKPRRSVCVSPSENVVLRCDVMATPTAKITWLKDRTRIPKADNHYLMLHQQSSDAVSSVLLIYDTTTTDSGWYTCLASSSAVTRRIHTHVTVSQCGDSFSGNSINGDDTEGEDDNYQDGNNF